MKGGIRSRLSNRTGSFPLKGNHITLPLAHYYTSCPAPPSPSRGEGCPANPPNLPRPAAGDAKSSTPSPLRLTTIEPPGSQREGTDLLHWRADATIVLYTNGGVVDKVVSVGSGRRTRVGSHPTTYRSQAMPFVEWFSYLHDSLSPRYPGCRWLHQRCAWVVIWALIWLPYLGQ
ncbi:hypothetical protein E2C01_090177 [Portunus trituberculatus]|uniref:Uncharacterized protein n=1 Tax=Portunus trituberculatus TaxID=210409 RepID=A0A5B7JRH8_PORTR|nr:hypothetical protein [Portunus trituberculatus]